MHKDKIYPGNQESWKEKAIFTLILFLSVSIFIIVLLVFKDKIIFLKQDKSPGADFLNLRFLRPEPFERASYILGLVYFPVVFFIFYQAFYFIDKKYNKLFSFCERGYFKVLSSLLMLSFVIAAGHIILRNANREYGFNVFFNRYWLSAAAFLYVLFLLLREKVNKANLSLFFVIGIGAVFITSLTQIIHEAILLQFPSVKHHFCLILGVVNQVLHGRTILVDTSSQYGIAYPYFAALFVKIFGPSIFNISAFFVALIFLSFLLIFLSIHKLTGRRPALSLFFFISFLGVIHPFYAGVILTGVNEPFYQYTPIRLFFGAFFIWFIMKYIENETKRKYLAGLTACGISFLWNMDTGMVVVLSWLGFLVYSALSRNDLNIKDKAIIIIRHITAVSLTFFLSIAAYSLFAFLRSHKFPAWKDLFLFQSLFYNKGYFMLPMSQIDLWNVPIFIYLVVLLSCVIAVLRKKADDRDRLRFFLVLFGLGIFTYYLGRSYATNIFPVSYPALFLFICLLNDFSAKYNMIKGSAKYMFKKSAFYFDLIAVFPLCLILAYGAVGFFIKIPVTLRVASYNIRHMKDAYKDPQGLEMVSFINDNKKDKEIIVFSDEADYLYFRTGTFSALPFSSLCEIVTVQQAEKIDPIISSKNARQIFLDTYFSYRELFPVITSSLDKNCKIGAMTESGRMILLERKL